MNGNHTKIKIFVLIMMLSLGLYSCFNDHCNLTIQTNGYLTLIDSAAATKNLLTYDPHYRCGVYPVYYIGTMKDTIRLGKEKIPIYEFSRRNYTQRLTLEDSLKMKIVVDTSFSLTHTVYFRHLEENENKLIQDSTWSFKAYAVFVYNLCDSLLWVGIFGELGHTVRQAQNSKGDWIDIETPINYFCATGARDIIVGPKQVLIGKLLRYKGDFKTKCRLKYTRWNRTIYSNIFVDYIDKRQLTDTLENEY